MASNVQEQLTQVFNSAEAMSEYTNWDQYWIPSDRELSPGTNPQNWELHWIYSPNDHNVDEKSGSFSMERPNSPISAENSSPERHSGSLQLEEASKVEVVPQELIDSEFGVGNVRSSKIDLYRLETIRNDLRAKRDSWEELDAPAITADLYDTKTLLEEEEALKDAIALKEAIALKDTLDIKETLNLKEDLPLEEALALKEAIPLKEALVEKVIADEKLEPTLTLTPPPTTTPPASVTEVPISRNFLAERAQRMFADMKSFLPNVKTLLTPTLSVESLLQSVTPNASPDAGPKQLGPVPRLPMATYTRVKSRLQDRPPTLAAFEAQVSRFGPSTFIPKGRAQLSKENTSKQSARSLLVKNLKEYLLPIAAKSRKHETRSLASILATHTAPKQKEEAELDPLDDSSIPQYQKWKKIKNVRLHNAQWAGFITTCILLICAVHVTRLREIIWYGFAFWQWLALAFVAGAGRLISGWGVKLIVILVEYNFLLKKRVLYFVFGLRSSVKNLLWQGLLLATWISAFSHQTDTTTFVPIVTKALWSSFTASSLWVMKVLGVKILANTFHRTAYFDRIQDSLFHQYVLETLSEPSNNQGERRGTDISIATTEKKNPFMRARAVPIFQLRRKPAHAERDLNPVRGKNLGRIERPYSPAPKNSPHKVVADAADAAARPSWLKYTSKFNPLRRFIPPSLQSSGLSPINGSPTAAPKKHRRRFHIRRHRKNKSKPSEAEIPTATPSRQDAPEEQVPKIPQASAPLASVLEAELAEATGSLQPSIAGVGEAADISHIQQIPAELLPPPTPAAPKRISFHKPSSIEEEEGELEDETGGEQTVAQDQIQLLTKDSVSAWTLMRLIKVVRTHNLTMFSYSSLLSADWEIDSTQEAKAAANHIFKNVAEPGRQDLVLSDFEKYLPPDKAMQAFSSFEVTVNGTITKESVMKWVVDVYNERKSLSLTLNDNRTVIYNVNRLLDLVVIALTLAITFLIMGLNNQTLLVCTSLLILPSVSIFGNYARNAFESLLFLFIMHPFDVGDRISIEGVPLTVEEMNITNTKFLNSSNEKISYPNIMLANKPISNIHRSPDQWDGIEIQILASTPLEKISIFKDRIHNYIVRLPQIWYPRWRLVVKDIEDSSKLKLYMTVQHHINFQDGKERWQRRSNILLHIETVLKELGIGYHFPPGEALLAFDF